HVAKVLENAPLHYPEKGRAAPGGRLFGALGPANRALYGLRGVLIGNGIWSAFVKAHHDVGAQVSLDADSRLGGEQVAGAVDVRLKPDSFFFDFVYPGQAEDLEPAAVGQYRMVPAHKFVKPAQARHSLVPRAQVEVICICKDDLRSERLQFVRGNAFDGADRSDWHEYGSIDRAVSGFKPPGTGVTSRIF